MDLECSFFLYFEFLESLDTAFERGHLHEFGPNASAPVDFPKVTRIMFTKCKYPPLFASDLTGMH